MSIWYCFSHRNLCLLKQLPSNSCCLLAWCHDLCYDQRCFLVRVDEGVLNSIPNFLPISAENWLLHNFARKSMNHRDWKINPKVHLEAQKTANSQGNTEQKQQCWRYHNTWLQTTLQSHSNKNSMVLAQKQIWRPVTQNRGPGYESTQPCTPYFWQRY
jgi:hypothetical protein